ncbi:MAG: hypothetical protein KF850_20455 [Labilithrix sp.]|nr:hypothetical protein [Labilithrix sp.]
MTPPKRLIDEGTALDQALLRAARADRPAPGFERRVIAAAVGAAAPAPPASGVRPSLAARLFRPRFMVIAALGIGAAAFSSLSGTQVAPGGGASAPVEGAHVVAAATAPPPRAEDAVAVTPDTLPSAPSVAAPSVAALAVAAPSVAAPAVAAPSVAAPAVAAPIVVAPSVAVTAPVAAVVPPSGPVLVRGEPGEPSGSPRAETPSAPASPPVAVSGASLQREVELLDAVKRGLRAGQAAEAERALDAYDVEFQQGAMKQEAGFLRIRLLLAKGDRAGAVALGEELLRRHPDNVHAKRIRAVLAADGADKTRAETSPR